MTTPDAGHTMETLDSRGAPLPYRRYGAGPGLVIVHGMMQTGDDQSDLARQLGHEHSVYLYDRAGFASRRSQPFVDLAPTLAHDADLVIEATAAPAHEPCNITSLLLGTTGSPEYFRKALTHLEAELPSARRVTIEGKGHQVTSNADRGGDPACVAKIVARYLLDRAPKAGGSVKELLRSPSE